MVAAPAICCSRPRSQRLCHTTEMGSWSMYDVQPTNRTGKQQEVHWQHHCLSHFGPSLTTQKCVAVRCFRQVQAIYVYCALDGAVSSWGSRLRDLVADCWFESSHAFSGHMHQRGSPQSQSTLSSIHIYPICFHLNWIACKMFYQNCLKSPQPAQHVQQHKSIHHCQP